MILDEGQSTAPSAKLHTDPLPFFDRKILWSNAGVLKCFARGSQGQRNRARDVFAILRTEFSFPIEALYLGSNLNRRFRDVERFDSPNAAFATLQSRPKCFPPNTDRRDAPHSGNYNSSWGLEVVQH